MTKNTAALVIFQASHVDSASSVPQQEPQKGIVSVNTFTKLLILTAGCKKSII